MRYTLEKHLCEGRVLTISADTVADDVILEEMFQCCRKFNVRKHPEHFEELIGKAKELTEKETKE